MRGALRACVGLGLLIGGCGGAAPTPAAPTPPPDPAVAAEAAERAKLDADRPASPYETRAVHAYAPPADCGQGPYRIPAGALGTRFGERLIVDVCAPRDIEGDYRFTDGTRADDARHFGYSWASADPDRHCEATATELAQPGGAGSGAGAAGSHGHGDAAHASASATPVALREVAIQGEDCPPGTHRSWILDYTIETELDTRPRVAGQPMLVDVWGARPLHLAGAVFLVRQTAPREGLTLEQWLAYRAALAAWTARAKVFDDRDLASGRMHLIDSTPHVAEAPPPPQAETRPPAPSEHAEWIPGYWHRETTWGWIPGFWRVPDADIAADRTTHAPSPPPTERAETPSAAPTPIAVWTPGFWAWDGRGYLWIAGAWRIPPARGQRWITPSWRPRGHLVVFVPGGWARR